MDKLGSHYSCTELHQFGLPGFPRTRRGIEKMLMRSQWPYVISEGRGGAQREFQVPAAVQAGIRLQLAQRSAANAAKQLATDANRHAGSAQPDLLDQESRQASDREVLARLESFTAGQRRRFEARRAPWPLFFGYFLWRRKLHDMCLLKLDVLRSPPVSHALPGTGLIKASAFDLAKPKKQTHQGRAQKSLQCC